MSMTIYPSRKEAKLNGGTRYHGKACSYCCGTERYTSSGHCVCNMQYKAYRERNPEKAKARVKDWRKRNRDKANDTSKRWRKNHPEQMRELYKVSRDVWNANNPEKAAAIAKSRRSRRDARLKAGGSFTPQEWLALVDATGHICLCCKTPDTIRRLTVDHVVPLAKGGANTIDNLQPLCLPCNVKKGTSVVDYRPRLNTGGDSEETTHTPGSASQ